MRSASGPVRDCCGGGCGARAGSKCHSVSKRVFQPIAAAAPSSPVQLTRDSGRAKPLVDVQKQSCVALSAEAVQWSPPATWAGWDAKHLPNVYFSLREASKHLPSRPKHLQPAPTVTRARPGGGPLPHSPGAPRPGQPLATYLGSMAARYAGISPVLARLNPLFRSKNPYRTLSPGRP